MKHWSWKSFGWTSLVYHTGWILTLILNLSSLPSPSFFPLLWMLAAGYVCTTTAPDHSLWSLLSVGLLLVVTFLLFAPVIAFPLVLLFQGAGGDPVLVSSGPYASLLYFLGGYIGHLRARLAA